MYFVFFVSSCKYDECGKVPCVRLKVFKKGILHIIKAVQISRSGSVFKSRSFIVIKILITHLFIIYVITVNTATCCCGNRTTSFCCVWHYNRCLQQSVDFTTLAELCLLISLIDGLVVVIQEYDFDLCRGSSGGSQTVRCLWPITIVFQFKYISIKCSQVLGGRVDSIRRGTVFCYVQNGYKCTWIWLLCLYAAHQTTGDQWKTTDFAFLTGVVCFLCKLRPLLRDSPISHILSRPKLYSWVTFGTVFECLLLSAKIKLTELLSWGFPNFESI